MNKTELARKYFEATASRLSDDVIAWVIDLADIFPDCTEGVNLLLASADFSVLAPPSAGASLVFFPFLDLQCLGRIPLFSENALYFYQLLASSSTSAVLGLVLATLDAERDGVPLPTKQKPYFKSLEDVRVYLRSKFPSAPLGQETFRPALGDFDGLSLLNGRHFRLPRTVGDLLDAGDCLNICTGGHARRIVGGEEARLFVCLGESVEYVVVIEAFEGNPVSHFPIVGHAHRLPPRSLCIATLRALRKGLVVDISEAEITEYAARCPE